MIRDCTQPFDIIYYLCFSVILIPNNSIPLIMNKKFKVDHVFIIPKKKIHDTFVTFLCMVFGHIYSTERHAVNYDWNNKCLSYKNRKIITLFNLPNIWETQCPMNNIQTHTMWRKCSASAVMVFRRDIFLIESFHQVKIVNHLIFSTYSD